MAIDADVVIVGAPDADITGFNAVGAAYFYARDLGGPNAWGEAQKLVASDPQAFDQFGDSVAIWGRWAIVGSRLHDVLGMTNHGVAYAFELDSATGSEFVEVAKFGPANGEASNEFGSAVAIDGDTVLVGSDGEDTQGLFNAGSAFVFALGVTAQSYCQSGVSASGCSAQLSATGTASASASTGYVITASGVEGAKDGILFFGTNGRQENPWGSGTSFQCVKPPVQRAGLQIGSGTIGACNGSFTQDLNAFWCPTCPKASKNPGAGTYVQAQLWYRDPQNTSNRTTSFSDAIESFVSP